MNAGTKMILDAEDRFLNKGIAIGEAKGRAEGRAEAMAEAVLRFVRERFGSVPKKLEAKLSASPAEELDGWLGRVARATSLEELLGDARGKKHEAPA